MTATVPITLPSASAARRLHCDLCWALPGRPCTISGQPGDHLARIIAAVELGLLSGAELETDDRQYALEQIDDIVNREQQ